ncbi:F-box domain-containing protein [Mycena sanguinolenta]|uniref:F-box domain-containing protein n=1 Tax=Mycena sanguinolenta TaxID=230812 RepID=A0A8H7D2G1_9AGAR|nr:F-box domain-containing protein [Mycena sanguinolenta]
MSDHSLPDEIISEILSPALKVSDELFCNNDDVSPFAKNSESTSAYLVVCKSWLRVATPLLYNVVVLRSKAQAKALSVALSGNKELGRFIKKLRVEGGYGAPLQTILQCSPNISDLFLSLVIYSSDNTSGLCRGLQLINPSRLILQEQAHKPLENKMASQLIEALIRAMAKWDRLCSFDSPYIYENIRATKLIQPLAKSKRLHTLAIPCSTGLSWTYLALKECPLEVIHIKQPVSQWERERFDKDPELKALLKYTEVSARKQTHISELPLIAPSLNPFFIPMNNAPKDVQDKVWDRVLYFAMSVPERADESPWARVSRRRLPLLSVSKRFARLGLPHYYAHVLLRKSLAIPEFASVLRNKPTIGPHIRTLAIGYYPDFDYSSLTYHQINSGILSQTTGLVRLSQYNGSAAISWDAFEAVAASSGSKLREFSVRIAEQAQASAMMFGNLTALRTLKWTCSTSFLLTNVPEDGLQNLTELQISSTSESFLTVLSLMKLKSLKRVMLCTNDLTIKPFLKAHGPKLIELHISSNNLRNLRTQTTKILDLCPNLGSLSLVAMVNLPMGDIPIADDLYSCQAVPSLVKINLDIDFPTQVYPSASLQVPTELLLRDKDHVAAWEKFFRHLQPKRLPNLHEIEVKCCVWPTNERDIPKNHWVRWAEILLECGINLTDKTGTKWRPRLKVSK